MNIHSHPEIEERERDDKVDTYPCNRVLRERLRAKREEAEFSNKVISKRLGVSEAVVSQYLNDAGCVYPGDVSNLELKVVDFLENEARRRASGVSTVNSSEAEQVRQGLEYIRKTSDAGIILAHSGEGKSRGLEYYVKNNPTAIYYPTYSWACGKHDAATFMFQVAGQAGYDNRTKREVHAVNKLRGSERLLIVDDAHFLHFTALKWWIDFHQATQMPLALVGTYKLMTFIEIDPQIFSRVGIKWEIKRVEKDGKTLRPDRDLLKHMIAELMPKDNNPPMELTDLCAKVAVEHGCYRSVHKQLKLAVEIKAGTNRAMTWPEAFHAAHTMLVRNYNLN